MTQPRREATGGEPTPLRRRAPWTRLSVGHLLMLVAGALAALANFAILRANDDSTLVVAAARDIPAGWSLTPEDLKLVALAADRNVLSGLVVSPDAVAGMLTSHAIAAGDLMLPSSVAKSNPNGLRTMSLPIDKAHAIGGALRPGDIVDVIAVNSEAVEYVGIGLTVVAVAPGGQSGLSVADDYHVVVDVDASTALRLAAALAGDGLEILRATGAPPPDQLSRDR